ncbi:Bidirectional hydrogenase H subunit [Candidatus Sulfotelmatobacter kueseliae]|uniref:Bidirectional hydrogenase H subunit n=1 Tax=Candidatus Sulfotelmatobacter kueseliae TaxID=2042962 RepID=A0A2U3KT21_9BACT|nr:Bidirectional hydrogenase H subunit [Candidatus Sulfotelmatobacter kueseliae]
MTKRITIEPISRIEGHGKITIHLDGEGHVASSEFHVTQIRGFEKFTEGRPFYEMPGITARICGICPISHLLASAKACDAIMAVRIPPAARKLRELVHCAQMVQSHALSFFYLSAPDLLLGMNSDPATRNVMGVIADHPELARDGIELRKFGLHIVEGLAQERVHPSWIVPGGVETPLAPQVRDHILSELPSARAITERTMRFFKGALDNYKEEISVFGSFPTMYAGLVDGKGNLQFYDGNLRFRGASGEIIEDQIAAEDYKQWIGEASLRESYLKAPYFIPQGFPGGVYRVGPLGRLNAAGACGTPAADAEFREFHERFGAVAHSAFLYHYARLIEITHALEKIEMLLNDPHILDTHVRATAGVNALEGVGMIEAPRGTLIHHYKVNEEGAITWANLIVATGHNNLAIGRSVQQVAAHYVDGTKLNEGMLNHVSAVVRAYDPCLSCSTHADGSLAMRIRLLDAEGRLLDEVAN